MPSSSWQVVVLLFVLLLLLTRRACLRRKAAPSLHFFPPRSPVGNGVYRVLYLLFELKYWAAFVASPGVSGEIAVFWLTEAEKLKIVGG
jgi:hypothetical protein